MKPPFVRSPYNYDTEKASDETAYVETMPSLTVQSMTEDADLNVIMKRFGVTGKLPENARLPSYGDFLHITDYRSAIDAARAAEESFLQFPADVRSQFENNPQLFLDFVENPANIDTVKKWFPNQQENTNGNNDRSAPRGGTAVDGAARVNPPAPGGSGSSDSSAAPGGQGAGSQGVR